MDPAHRNTTLDQILRHRAGLQGFEEDTEFEKVPRFAGGAREKREAFVQWLLERPPESEPGSEHRYSNAGYSVAAVMMEQATGESWESLLESRVLVPLEVEHYCFGWPSEHLENGICGHRLEEDTVVPHDPEADAYRLEDQYIGPAGDLSLDIVGLARFARLHLQGLDGKDGILAAESIRFLHAPLPDDTYAIGWNASEKRSSHVGSAGTFFAVVYIMKERGVAMVAAANLWSEDEVEFGKALLVALLDSARENGDLPE